MFMKAFVVSVMMSMITLACAHEEEIPKVDTEVETEEKEEEEKKTAAESVSIADLKQLSVKAGETVQMKAVIVPADADEKPVWTSSDTEVFTVDAESGELQAVAAGMAELRASVSGASASIPVLVHGDLWIEQTDALVRPVSFENFAFTTDTIRLARGETATFQGIVYASTNQGVVSPEITRFALEGQEGIAVEPELYWLRDIKCSEKWDAWAGGRAPDAYPSYRLMIPDPQMPVQEEAVSLDASQRRALWAEFTIPEGLQAGLYKGRVEVTGASEKAGLDFYVQVYDVTLPQEQSMNIVQWMNTDRMSIMNNGEAVDMEAVYETYAPEIVGFMNDYGQNCWLPLNSGYNVKASFSVGAEYNAEKGIYQMKYTFNDEYWARDFEFFEEHCKGLKQIHGKNIVAARDATNGWLTVTSYRLDENGGVAVDGSGAPMHTYVTFPNDDPKEIEMSKTLLRDYFYQLQEYLRSHRLKDGRTWLDIYVQTVTDEPNDKLAEAYNQISRIIREAAPDLKRLEPLETGLLDPSVLDYPCPTLGKIHEFRAVGDQVQWMYTCMQPQGNYANRFIRIPLFKTRLVHWVQYKYGASGYLHWGLNYWQGAPDENPWADASGSYIGGDMWIIWPGYRTVYPSIRLSAMRDGIRDYELLKMVEGVSPAKAEEICGKVVRSNAYYNLEVSNFRQVRREMLEFLEDSL